MIKTLFIYLSIASSAHAQVERFNDDVWLPLDVFRMEDALKDFSGLIFNPVRRETRHLPKGWIVSDFVALSDREPWLPIQRPLRMHESYHDLVNIHSGKLLFGGENKSIQPIDRVREGGFLARDLSTDRYLWIALDGTRVVFPESVNSVSTGSLSEGLWSAYDKNSRPVYIDRQGQLVQPSTPITLPVADGWELLRADSFHDGLALAAIGQNVSYGPRRFGFINRKFEWVIPPQFDEASAFQRGRAWVLQNQKWGLINTDGEWIIQPKFRSKSHGEAHEFILGTTDEHYRTAVFSARGNFLFNLPEDAAFSQNYCFINDGTVGLKVGSSGESRFFDLRSRQWLGKITYSPRTSFVNGYAKVEIHGENIEGTDLHAFAEAFIDRNGEIIAFLPRFGPPQKMLPQDEFKKLQRTEFCDRLLLGNATSQQE